MSGLSPPLLLDFREGIARAFHWLLHLHRNAQREVPTVPPAVFGPDPQHIFALRRFLRAAAASGIDIYSGEILAAGSEVIARSASAISNQIGAFRAEAEQLTRAVAAGYIAATAGQMELEVLEPRNEAAPSGVPQSFNTAVDAAREAERAEANLQPAPQIDTNGHIRYSAAYWDYGWAPLVLQPGPPPVLPSGFNLTRIEDFPARQIAETQAAEARPAAHWSPEARAEAAVTLRPHDRGDIRRAALNALPRILQFPASARLIAWTVDHETLQLDFTSFESLAISSAELERRIRAIFEPVIHVRVQKYGGSVSGDGASGFMRFYTYIGLYFRGEATAVFERLNMAREAVEYFERLNGGIPASPTPASPTPAAAISAAMPLQPGKRRLLRVDSSASSAPQGASE